LLRGPEARRYASPARVVQRQVGRRHVIGFEGELDIATVPALDRALEAAVADAATEVWIDLTETTFMDAAGVHCLLRARAALAPMNRRLAVICADGPARRVLALTGVDESLELFPDRAAAHHAA
jgi:anti-sigma B factor antagonist